MPRMPEHADAPCRSLPWLRWAFGWIAAAFLLVAAPLRAQDLVVNGNFNGGSLAGWSGNPGYIGYVPSVNGAWIGISGQLYQDLPTVPGTYYELSFATQRFDPSQSWRPNSLNVQWGGEVIAQFNFVEGDNRWLRPHFILRATGTTTRLRFFGIEHPSIDSVAVFPAGDNPVTATMTSPAPDTAFLEGDPIPLHATWANAQGPLTMSGTFLLNGVTSIGAGESDPTGVSLTWTNAPPGVHYLSASGNFQVSTPVRVTVVARPKLFVDAPANRQVVAPGASFGLVARLVDNAGTNAMTRVRFLVGGQLVGVQPVSGTRVSQPWNAVGDGAVDITLVGENADGNEVARASSTAWILPRGTVDLAQLQPGGSMNSTASAPIAQTFVAGTSGRLVAFEVAGGSNLARDDFEMQVDLVELDPATQWPGTTVLGSTRMRFAEARTVPSEETLRFAFPSNRVTVVAGRRYAAVFRYLGTGEFYLRDAINDPYAGGVLLQKSGAQWKPASFSTVASTLDLVFRTFVVPATPPVVTLSSPAPLAWFPAGVAIPLAASVSTAAQSPAIRRVTFLADGVPVGSVEAPPYEFSWTPASPGNHVVDAIAEDLDGVTAQAGPVSVLSGLDPAGLPRLGVADTVSPEGNASLPPLVFEVVLSAPSATPVTVAYRTRDLGAVAGVDYLAVSGTVSFAPGQTRAYVFVRILADTLPKPSRRLALDLLNPDGAVLERPSATGVIVDDEPGPGKPSRYVWTVPDGIVTPGQPFHASLAALDPSGAPVSDVPGGVRITAGTLAADDHQVWEGLHRGSVQDTFGGTTVGARFVPRTDVLVTHFRTMGASKVTLWSDDQQRLATVPFGKSLTTWLEKELPAPVLLRAGRAYRIALYTGYNALVLGDNNVAPRFEEIGYWTQCGGQDDSFPSQTANFMLLMLDLRYRVWTGRPDALDAVRAEAFPQGTWDGELSLPVPRSEWRLLAEDVLGNTGVSGPLRMEPPVPVLARDRSRPAPAFLFSAPRGVRFRVATSTNLRDWTPAADTIVSDGTPVPWRPADPDAPAGFLRLEVVE